MEKKTQAGGEMLAFYSFNGTMERAEIERQVREMAAQGFTGFFVHARAGLEIPYMQEEWFDRFGLCVELAQELGLSVYLYDENGWPSGFCGGAIPAMGESYQYKALHFSAGMPDVPPERILAAYVRGQGACRRIPLTEITADSLVAYYMPDENYVDVLDRETMREFIRRTHEVYKQRFGQYFGGVIKGIFTDEPQMFGHRTTYSFALPDFYAENYGGDVLDELWKLDKAYFDEAFCDRYMRALGGLFRQSFSAQIGGWCAENGLMLTGHYAGEDGLRGQILSNGGVMANYIYEQIPGIDHLGRRLASPVLLKQVTGAAEMLQKPHVLSEVFGCAGWDVSFAELARIWGWHTVFGVDLPCLHLAAYTIKGRRKRDYPAFFSYQEPWWERTYAFLDWMKRAAQFSHAGSRRPQVLVLSDVDGCRGCALSADGEDLAVNAASNQFRLLLSNLLDAQIDFDIGDEAVMAQAGVCVTNDGIQAGPFRYTTLIVPDMPSVSTAQLALIRGALSAGVRVWFVNRRPQRVDLGAEQPLFAAGEGVVIRNRRDLWIKAFKAVGFCRTAQLTGGPQRDLPKDVVLRCTFDGGTQSVMLFHAGAVGAYRDLQFSVPYAAEMTLCRLTDGAMQPLDSDFTGKKTVARIDLAAGEMKVIMVRRAERSAASALRVRQAAECLPVRAAKVTLTDPNVLTVDYAAFSVNGAPYSPEKPVIHLLNEIYRGSAADGRMTLRMRYTFRCEMSDPTGLTLAFEDSGAVAFAVNGTPMPMERTGWYIDRSIGRYAIGAAVVRGENTVEITYEAKGQRVERDRDKVFETVKNIFFYEIEPESLYILGDFDVCHEGRRECEPYLYRLESGGFVLRDAKERRYADITAQNCWFYRGNARYCFPLPRQEGKRTFLEAAAPACTAAAVFVNGNEAGMMVTRPFRVELTKWLTEPENRIEVVAYGHNRNALGPHHHIMGNPNFVGVDTFEGVYGYEDFVSPEVPEGAATWTDDYAVVPFGIGQLAVELIPQEKAERS